VLHKDQETRDKWIGEMPKLEEMFKKQATKEPEHYVEMLENFILKLEEEAENTSGKTGSASSARNAEIGPPPAKKTVVVSESSSTEEEDEELLDKAFEGI
jgi:L-lactate utilization protein LutB